MKVCWFSTGISSFIAAYLTPDLDELGPSRGRKQDEISEECGIACELKWDDIRRYYHA